MLMTRKTVLILGGANQHVKVAQAAAELGFRTIVADYLPREDSPAKLIADEDYQVDINDIDTLAEICRAKHVDGVVAG